MKKVAVVTDFYSISAAYSLNTVASSQIAMFLRAGYKPRVLVDVNFPKEGNPYPWDSVELFSLPSIPRSNKVELPPDWQTHLDKMTDAMREGLKDIEVACSHDLIYQPAQILYNMAARQVTKERGGTLRWLHLVHSATSPSLINAKEKYLEIVKTKFPHSFVCFPNAYSRPRVARNFGYEENEIKFTPHATDFCKFMGFLDITKKLVNEKSMLGADVIMIYPVRLDRGKQVEFPIRIAAQLKQLGKSVRFVCQDFHSTGGDKVNYRADLRKIAQQLGLSDVEVTFTSEFDKSLHLECPRQMVRDLMLLSNVFILPSRSETYSLVAQEAALSGNLLILNYDFPIMRDIYGEAPLYFKFSSNLDAMTGLDGDTNVEYHPSVDAYCADIAKRIIYELMSNRVLHLKTFLRQERNPDHVFRNYWEPLLYAFEEG